MKNSQLTINTLLIMAFLLSVFQEINAQNNKEETLFNWFDNELGRENLTINNGPLHLNYDRTANGEHRYYNSNKFSTGSITYEGQNYYGVNIKYDIYKDVLILNPKGESEYMGVDLIKEKVSGFFLNDKKFINLNGTLPADFTQGYYEESYAGSKLTFYIKHRKEAKQILKNESVLIDYDVNDEFVLYRNASFIKIDSKNDLIKLFPDYKKDINDFYSVNRSEEKKDKTRFMESVIRHINNFTPNESN